jgi:hypothetical protein
MGMRAIKQNDHVRIVAREVTPDDTKSGTYFEHYAGLTATVLKIYDNGDCVLDVDTESLTKEVRVRHDSIRDQMKTKWLDGLSEEGRSKLTEREKDFLLRYTLLARVGDLEKIAPKPEPPSPVAEVPPPRKTLAELEAAEEEELRRRSAGS